MHITLMATFDSGQVGFSPERIEGIDAPRRSYNVVNGKLTLAGQHELVLHHDAQELLALPDGLYRLPTPAEQEAWATEQAKAGQIQETQASEPEQTARASEQASDNQSPEPPLQGGADSDQGQPAAKASKKASGD